MKADTTQIAQSASRGLRTTSEKTGLRSALAVAMLVAGTGIADMAQAQSTKGGICTTNQSRITGAEHVWICEHLGRVTIRQIYEKGFRVVSAYSSDPAEKTAQYQYLIIEEASK